MRHQGRERRGGLARNLFGALAVYGDRRMLAILLMGFSSGLPLQLTGSTLSVWLAESGVSLTAIGFFALVGLSYNFKFLWAPLIDRAPLPGLTRLLGRRRGWAAALQLALALAIAALGFTDPAAAPATVALVAVVVAFLSASQDIVVDAFRVELLKEDEQGAGAAVTQIGYRFGIIASTFGTLYLAEFFGWQAAYAAMAVSVALGLVGVLMAREPKAPPRDAAPGWLGRLLVQPFTEFMRRDVWLTILLFIVLYKLGDALAAVVSSPFYITLGFTKVEIANITKLFGVLAAMLGVFLGGLVVYRLGLMRALLVCGILQMVSNLMFVALAWAGHDTLMLTLTIAIENVAGGMGSAAFVAYLSSLCHRSFTATQYALLSALAALPRTLLASNGGWLAELLGWAPFFLATTLAALPGLLLLLWLMRYRPLAAAPATLQPQES